jgi:hypothetical protein
MNRSTMIVAALLVALGGAAQAQTPASNDPIVQMRAEETAANKVYSDKKKALDAPRDAKVKAAGDKAAADASAKGQDPLVARRDAEAGVKSATKKDYDAKLKALKKQRDHSLAEIRKKYPAAGATAGSTK